MMTKIVLDKEKAMRKQYVIIVYSGRLEADEVLGPFSTESSAIEFARLNVEDRYLVRPLSSPEFS